MAGNVGEVTSVGAPQADSPDEVRTRQLHGSAIKAGFTADLGGGASSEIKDVQEALNKFTGTHLKADGVYGPRTNRALVAVMQRATPELRAALLQELGPAVAAKVEALMAQPSADAVPSADRKVVTKVPVAQVEAAFQPIGLAFSPKAVAQTAVLRQIDAHCQALAALHGAPPHIVAAQYGVVMGMVSELGKTGMTAAAAKLTAAAGALFAAASAGGVANKDQVATALGNVRQIVKGEIAETTKPEPLNPLEIGTLMQIQAMAATIPATGATAPAIATAEFSRMTKMAVKLTQQGRPVEGGKLIALLANLHAQSTKQPPDQEAAFAALSALQRAVKTMITPT